jgi:hypothetical protein
MKNRLVTINGFGSDDDRAAAYKRLAAAIVEGTASCLTSDELEMLRYDTESAAKALVPSAWCLLNMWNLLSTASGNLIIREMAYRILANKTARCRVMAINYVLSNYPGEAPGLYQQYVNDQDPELLSALAWFIRPHDSTKATHLLIDAFILPITTMLWDTLELEIIGFGEEEHLRRLRDLQNNRSDGGLLKSLADNLETKLRSNKQL